MTIYGLFDYSYDYHTFESFLMASKKLYKLEKLCTESIPVVFTVDEHEKLASDEIRHYYIKQLEVI